MLAPHLSPHPKRGEADEMSKRRMIKMADVIRLEYFLLKHSNLFRISIFEFLSESLSIVNSLNR